jgi:PAB1-binding protein PBP1
MSYNDVNIDYRKKYDFLLKKQKSQGQFIAFEKKLQSKTQDDCFSDDQREKRFKRETAKQYDFVHTLSYNKAIGAISRADEKQLFQGSSYNRKKTEKKPKTEKNSIDLVDQSEKQPKKEKTTSNRTKEDQGRYC